MNLTTDQKCALMRLRIAARKAKAAARSAKRRKLAQRLPPTLRVRKRYKKRGTVLMGWALDQKCLALRLRHEAIKAAALKRRRKAADKALFAGMRRAAGLRRMRRFAVSPNLLGSSLGPALRPQLPY
jgi:hypothetical protein